MNTWDVAHSGIGAYGGQLAAIIPAMLDHCTCLSSFCRHDIGGCPNPAVLEITVSVTRGDQQEPSTIRNKVCAACWACLQINQPNIFGDHVGSELLAKLL